MPIQYSRLIPVSCAWHSSFPHDRWSCCCQQRLYFLFRDSEARPGLCEPSMKPDPCSLPFWYIACFHHDLYRTLSQQHTLPFFLFFFIIIRKIPCLLEKQISSAPFFPLASHNPVMLASCSSCLPFSAHLPFLVLISSLGPILLPLVLLSLPRREQPGKCFLEHGPPNPNLSVIQLPTRVGQELRMGRVESIAYILRQRPWKKPLCLGTGGRPLRVGSRQWLDFDDHRDALHWTCCRCLEDACAFSVPLHDFSN